MRKNILFITGTRADYGLLKPVIKQMFQSPKMKPKVLATGIHALKKFGLTLGEIKKDEKFSRENIDLKRPGTGLPPKAFDKIVGRIAARNITADSLIKKSDTK